MATGKRSTISLTRRSRVLLSSTTRILIAKYKYRHDVYGLSCYTDLLIHQMSKPRDNRGMLAIFVILSILIISPKFCLCIFFVHDHIHVEVMLISNTATLRGNSSIKFGSVASFLTLSLLERNFPEGWGDVCQTVENLEGWGGGGGVKAYLKKWKIRGGGGS